MTLIPCVYGACRRAVENTRSKSVDVAINGEGTLESLSLWATAKPMNSLEN